MIKKYCKKPVMIEAMQLTWETNFAQLLNFVGIENIHSYEGGELVIKTLEGNIKASINDFVIKGIAGEFYPCKPQIFFQTYEEVEENERF
jgi:hypothetical protein